MRTPLLEVEGLEAYYGKSHILHGVTLNVGEGDATASAARRRSRRSWATSSHVAPSASAAKRSRA
jgi:branched-chain amino acid transport system ATP-binding protein